MTTTTTRSLGVRTGFRAGRALAVTCWFAALLSMAAFVIAVPRFHLALLSAGVIALLGAAVLLQPRSAILLVLGWLVPLGLVRRLTYFAGADASLDVLPLVGIALLGLLFLVAITSGPALPRTRLSLAVVGVQVVLLLSAINPRQGSLTAIVLALPLVLVPTTGFWIGRRFLDDRTFDRMVRLLIGAGLLTAVYGLFQTYVGFPSWDEQWLERYAYQALNVNGFVRSFGASVSASEYAILLAVALVLTAFHTSKLPVLLPALGGCLLLGSALVLTGARGPVVAAAAAIGLALAARRGVRLLPALALGAAAIVVLTLVVQRVVPEQTVSTDAQSALISRQVSGLANPLDEDSSTAVGHAQSVYRGVLQGFTQPLGSGLSALSGQSGRFGGAVAGTEADPSNLAVAAGLPGLLAYVNVAFLALATAFRVARRKRDLRTSMAVALIAVTFLQWFNPGHYLITVLPWLALGFLDAQDSRDTQDQQEAQDTRSRDAAMRGAASTRS